MGGKGLSMGTEGIGIAVNLVMIFYIENVMLQK